MLTIYLIFESFYRNICNLGILSNEDIDFVKPKTTETALSSYQNYNDNVPWHFSKEGFLALQNLHTNRLKILSSKNHNGHNHSDNGSSVVIVESGLVG